MEQSREPDEIAVRHGNPATTATTVTTVSGLVRRLSLPRLAGHVLGGNTWKL